MCIDLSHSTSCCSKQDVQIVHLISLVAYLRGRNWSSMDFYIEPLDPFPTFLVRGRSHGVQDDVGQFSVAATNNPREMV